MIKIIKKALICLLFICPIYIVKADTINISIKGNINIHYEYENNNINNITINLYKIADINNNQEYTYLENYKTIEKNINNMISSELGNYAKELEEYINDNNINSDKQETTNELGNCIFNNLDLGLYLIIYNSKTINNKQYKVAPTIIKLPEYNTTTNNYIYNIDTYPKVETTTISTNNDTSNIVDNNTSSKEKKGVIDKLLSIPKTGDNIIIYIVLLFISLLGIITVVLYKKRSRKKELKNEENK